MGKAYRGDEPLTVLHYTSGHLDTTNPHFAQTVRDQILIAAGDYPIVTVSQSPLDFGKNIIASDASMGVLRCVGRSHLNIYRAILIGAIHSETEFCGLIEDDCMVPPDHFRTHRPPPHKFAYDFSKWGINTWVRPPVFGYRSRAVINSLIAPRQLLIDALQERFNKYPDEEALKAKFGNSNPLKFWGDLGRYEKHLGVTVREWESFASPVPSVVFSHEEAFGFLSRGKRKSIGEGHRTELPGWGSAESMLALWTGEEQDGYPEVPREPFALTNMLGQSEMETAASLILEQVIRLRTWEVDMSIEDFQEADTVERKMDRFRLDYATTGFLYLLEGGWLEASEPTGCFVPSAELARRIIKLKEIQVERRHLCH